MSDTVQTLSTAALRRIKKKKQKEKEREIEKTDNQQKLNLNYKSQSFPGNLSVHNTL